MGSASATSGFATIKTLQVGDALIRDQVFLVLPITKGAGMANGMPVDGLIGYEVLSRFVTTFDYGNRQVVFHLPGSYTPRPGRRSYPLCMTARNRNSRAASTMSRRPVRSIPVHARR